MAKRGRPTKYSPDLILKVDEYLTECGIWMDEFHKTRGEKSDGFERIANVNLPKMEGFAQYLDVSTDTLVEWRKQYPDFSVALDKIMKMQHNLLVDNALAGNINPVISKLILSSNHGYREKTESAATVKMEVNNLTELSDDELANLAKSS